MAEAYGVGMAEMILFVILGWLVGMPERKWAWLLIVVIVVAASSTLGCSSWMKTTTTVKKPTDVRQTLTIMEEGVELCLSRGWSEEIKRKCIEAAFWYMRQQGLGIVCQIESKGDALVEYSKDGELCKADNRGGPTTLDRVVEYLMTKPDFKIGGSE